MPTLSIPFTDRDYGSFTFIEKRHVWSHLQLALMEPSRDKRRQTLFAAVAADNALKRPQQKNRRRQRFPTSRRLRRLEKYDLAKFEDSGGLGRIVNAPALRPARKKLKDHLKQLRTVHGIVSMFLRCYDYNSETASVSWAKNIVAKYKCHHDAYSTHKDIDAAWDRYKHVSHIVFSLLQSDVRIIYGKNFPERFIEVLSAALYVQHILSAHKIRNTKKPTLDADETLLIPILEGISARPPVLPPLTAQEIAVPRKRRGKNSSNAKKGSAPPHPDERTPPL
jgi:hypothetical protein